MNAHIIVSTIRHNQSVPSVNLGKTLVNRSNCKIYKQKGTGRARHGNGSSPSFRGGGRCHNKINVLSLQKINKKLLIKSNDEIFNNKFIGTLFIPANLLSKNTSDIEKLMKLYNINNEDGLIFLSEKINLCGFNNLNIKVANYKMNTMDLLKVNKVYKVIVI